jgi:hypothetical protein
MERAPEQLRAEVARVARDPDRSPKTRTPLRSRPLSFMYDPEGSSEEPLVRAAPSVLKIEQRGEAPKIEHAGGGEALLAEVRTIKKQQEELLAVISGLTRAVEGGMRTLNGRVRALEEQMQDLETALLSRSE